MERMQNRLRRFSVYPDGTGMYEVRGKLTAEVAAVLMRAVEAASDALYRSPAPASDVSGRVEVGADEDRPEPEQRRADALGLVAERALAAGLGFGDDTPISGSRAERYQVVLHVEKETLAEPAGAASEEHDARRPGLSELEDGTRVSAETSRRLSCDASRVVVRKSAAGDVLDVGRRTRTIPPALRRALEVRDRGCRFPGCGLRFTDAHHIEHWADGGRTDLNNTVLLCRRHHRLVHEEGHRICMDADGRVVFFSPSGRPIAGAGRQTTRRTGEPSGVGDDPLADLIRQNRSRGIEPAWDTILPSRHHRSQVPWELEANAWEALDRAAESAAAAEDATAGEEAVTDAGASTGDGASTDADPREGSDGLRATAA